MGFHPCSINKRKRPLLGRPCHGKTPGPEEQLLLRRLSFDGVIGKGQARFVAVAGVFVQHALGNGLINGGHGGMEQVASRGRVACSDSRTQTAHHGAHAGSITSTRPKQPNKHDELRLLIHSRHPIITVETPEEERLEGLLMDVATELGVPLYEWSVTTGLARAHGAPLYNSDSPEQAVANIALIQGDAIFLLKDFARYCENDKICRRLRDLAEKFRAVRRSIVLTAAKIELPADLEGDAMPFQLGLPGAEDLLAGVMQVLAELNREQRIPISLEAAAMRELAQNLVGLPEEEALRALRKSALERGKADAGLLGAVLETKREALKTEGLIETMRRDASFVDVAGLRRLRDWIAKRKNALTPEGRRFGLVPPKGVLITGVQGCGKSLAARAVAGEWGFELARLDAGALYDKYVGESERRFDEIFFVDLPNAEVRAALFALHLKRRGREASGFDLGKLAAASEGFSGAEIEQVIVAGLYTAFNASQQLNTEILLAEIQGTQPLSVTRAEEVQAIREWAKTRAVSAD